MFCQGSWQRTLLLQSGPDAPYGILTRALSTLKHNMRFLTEARKQEQVGRLRMTTCVGKTSYLPRFVIDNAANEEPGCGDINAVDVASAASFHVASLHEVFGLCAPTLIWQLLQHGSASIHICISMLPFALV